MSAPALRFCRCLKCKCIAKVERPDVMLVCDACHDKCYNYGTGNVREKEDK